MNSTVYVGAVLTKYEAKEFFSKVIERKVFSIFDANNSCSQLPLPGEVIKTILSMATNNIFNISLGCKQLYTLASSDEIWKSFASVTKNQKMRHDDDNDSDSYYSELDEEEDEEDHDLQSEKKLKTENKVLIYQENHKSNYFYDLIFSKPIDEENEDFPEWLERNFKDLFEKSGLKASFCFFQKYSNSKIKSKSNDHILVLNPECVCERASVPGPYEENNLDFKYKSFDYGKETQKQLEQGLDEYGMQFRWSIINTLL